MKKRFIDRNIQDKGRHIHKLKAIDSTGKWAYYVIMVNPEKESQFFESIDGIGIIDLEDFGILIASSYGEKLDDDLKRFFRERYNFHV